MRASIWPCFSLRGVVLGVLFQVAVLARDADLLGDLRALHGLQLLELGSEGLMSLLRHRIAVHAPRVLHPCPALGKQPARPPVPQPWYSCSERTLKRAPRFRLDSIAPVAALAAAIVVKYGTPDINVWRRIE